MTVYALQTARAGSKSVPDKNILPVRGLPLFLHNVRYAQQADTIKGVFTSTDSKFILDNADEYDYETIVRPPHLATDNCSHHDTMIHGLEEIESRTGDRVEILVILFGNAWGARTEDLNRAVQYLLDDLSLDSVQSVSEFNMFNPFRAYEENEGLLTTIVGQEFIEQRAKLQNINDRNSAGSVYFFNGSFWICRRETLYKRQGLLPFPWLGYRIKSYIQETLMEIDAPWQVKFFE